MDTKELVKKLVHVLIEKQASDLYLSEDRSPSIRVFGELLTLTEEPKLTTDTMSELLVLFVGETKYSRFKNELELDFAYQDPNGVRFRGNAFVQRGKVGISLRLIPGEIKTLASLNLPPILESFVKRKQGFFLVVGPVGQGKTTTLASMIDMINTERADHIITIENPIEYVYQQKKSIVDQREVGSDTRSFHRALFSTFRQDVDVILVGEMRDLETISTAVTAAETGHLVFATLHTNDASQTIDRIIDSFPPDQQNQIRLQLASSLIGIFSQRLFPRVSGGLIPAYELLIANSAVKNLIRKNKIHEIPNVIETGTQDGMISMNRVIADLIERGEIARENADEITPINEIIQREGIR